MTKFLFLYMFQAAAIVSALGVALSKKPMHSLLSLIATFVSISASWIILNSELIAIMQLLIYIGAILVLFLFITMMFNLQEYKKCDSDKRYDIASWGLFLVIVGVFAYIIKFKSKVPSSLQIMLGNYSDENFEFGKILFNQYGHIVLLSGLLLLVAMLAAIELGFTGIIRSKKQSVSKQMAANKQNRLIMINKKSKSSDSEE